MRGLRNQWYVSKHISPEQRRREWWLLVRVLGGKCVVCGKTKGLNVDHIFGDGYDDRRLFGGTLYTLYRFNHKLANERLQLLCREHHLRKHDLFGGSRMTKSDNDVLIDQMKAEMTA